jgi:hypothetical protein
MEIFCAAQQKIFPPKLLAYSNFFRQLRRAQGGNVRRNTAPGTPTRPLRASRPESFLRPFAGGTISYLSKIAAQSLQRIPFTTDLGGRAHPEPPRKRHPKGFLRSYGEDGPVIDCWNGVHG